MDSFVDENSPKKMPEGVKRLSTESPMSAVSPQSRRPRKKLRESNVSVTPFNRYENDPNIEASLIEQSMMDNIESPSSEMKKNSFQSSFVRGKENILDGIIEEEIVETQSSLASSYASEELSLDGIIEAAMSEKKDEEAVQTTLSPVKQPNLNESIFTTAANTLDALLETLHTPAKPSKSGEELELIPDLTEEEQMAEWNKLEESFAPLEEIIEAEVSKCELSILNEAEASFGAVALDVLLAEAEANLKEPETETLHDLLLAAEQNELDNKKVEYIVEEKKEESITMEKEYGEEEVIQEKVIIMEMTAMIQEKEEENIESNDISIQKKDEEPTTSQEYINQSSMEMRVVQEDEEYTEDTCLSIREVSFDISPEQFLADVLTEDPQPIISHLSRTLTTITESPSVYVKTKIPRTPKLKTPRRNKPNLSESLMEFVVTESKIEYEMKAAEVEVSVKELSKKIESREKELDLIKKERDDYMYMCETIQEKKNGEITTLRRKCHELQEEIDSMKGRLFNESQMVSLQALGERLDDMMKDGEAQAEVRSQLEADLRKVEQELMDSLKVKMDLEEDLKKTQEDLKMAREIIANITKQPEESVERLKALWEGEKSETDRLERENKLLQKTTVDHDRIVSQLEVELEHSKATISELEHELKNFRLTASESTAKLIELQKVYENENVSQEKEQEVLKKRLEELINEKNELEEKLQIATNCNEELEVALKKTDEELKEKDEKIVAMTNKITACQPTDQEITFKLTEMKHQYEIEKTKIESDLRLATESNSELEKTLKEKEMELKEIMEKLETKEQEIAQQAVLKSKIDELKNQLEVQKVESTKLETELGLATEANTELEMALKRKEEEFDTVNERLTTAEQESSQQTSLKEEVEKLKIQLEYQKVEVTKKETDLRLANEVNVELEAALKEKEGELEAVNEKLLVVEKESTEQKVLMSEIEDLKSQLEVQKSESFKLEADLHTAAAHIDELMKANGELENSLQVSNAAKEEREITLKKKDEQIEKLEAKNSESKVSLIMEQLDKEKVAREQAEADLLSAKDRIDEITKSRDEQIKLFSGIQESLKHREEVLLHSHSQIEKLVTDLQEKQKVELEAVNREKQEFLKKNHDLEDRCVALQKTVDELKRKIEKVKETEESNQEAKNLTKSNEVLTVTNQSLEEKCEKLQKSLEDLTAKLEREKKEAERAWKMCDEMDDLEADYKKRVLEQNEEIHRLKVKCGEIKETNGLLDALRPKDTNVLAPGSVNNSGADSPVKELLNFTEVTQREKSLAPISEQTLLDNSHREKGKKGKNEEKVKSPKEAKETSCRTQ